MKITALTLTDADTQYPFVMPTGHTNMKVRTRAADHTARMSLVAGVVATPTEAEGSYYATVLANAYWEFNGTRLSGDTLYFATDDAGAVLEIVTW